VLVTLSYVDHNGWVRTRDVLVAMQVHTALGIYLFIPMYLLPQEHVVEEICVQYFGVET
jgi:hypothetical protein